MSSDQSNGRADDDREVMISVKGLSKAYTITHDKSGSTTLAETITQRVRHPFRPRSDVETFWALKDVSFDVKRGDVVGVVGRNGAGKSTLFKVLSRITEPTQGEIDLYGRIGSLLEVGTGFSGELTGRENIFLNGTILGMTQGEVRRHFDAIVDFSGVEQFLDTPVKRYSSGMYVRLAFAVAAHLRTEILIIDEVLAVGDMAFQKKCLGKIGEISSEQGRTVLFVSHNMGTVKSLCTNAVWLDRGCVREVGPAADIVDRYLTETREASESTVDLTTQNRASWATGDARLLQLQFNEGRPLVNGEPLEIRVDFQAERPVAGIAVGLGICTLDGVRLLSLDTDLSVVQHAVTGGHRGSVVGRIERLDLQPGTYSIDVGIRSGISQALDYVGACGLVDVLAGPRTPGLIVSNAGGGLRLPISWEWESGMNLMSAASADSTHQKYHQEQLNGSPGII